jgi:peroxiredoxin Q/BCP
MAENDYPNLKDLADITLLSDEGKPLSLASFVGQRVLIFFFPRAATPGCTKQACGFRDAFPKIQANGATVIGISADEPKALAKWKTKEKLPYTLLSDPEHQIIEKFHAWGERSMYGRKFMGILRSHFVFNEAGELIASELRVSPQDSISKGVDTLLTQ